jgi:Flp pilus assembly protein TadD
MPSNLDEDWVEGRASLGAAAGWTAEEIRLVADLGYALADYGRNEEALTIFEGLAALAPATAYFQTALGALLLRMGELDRAEAHLLAALDADPHDMCALLNRGELNMQLQRRDLAIRDFATLLQLPEVVANPEGNAYAIRSRALLAMLTGDEALIAK